jgi:hypothetical protein
LQHIQQQQQQQQQQLAAQQPSSQQQQQLTPQLPPASQQRQQQQVVAFAPAKPRLTLQVALDLLASEGSAAAAAPAGAGGRENRGSSEGGDAVKFSVREGFKWLARYAADASDLLHGDGQLKKYLKVC